VFGEKKTLPSKQKIQAMILSRVSNILLLPAVDLANIDNEDYASPERHRTDYSMI